MAEDVEKKRARAQSPAYKAKQAERNARAIDRRDPIQWAAYMRAWRSRPENIERVREQERERSHRTRKPHRQKLRALGLTMADFDRMTAGQGGVCAICGGQPTGGKLVLDVDHDHGTGRVRALLCNACNRAMGLLGDDPERLEACAAYLRHHGTLSKPPTL